MHPGDILEHFSPYARVTTAVAPFLASLVIRLMLGKNRLSNVLISVSITWFAINVLLAPYSIRMQQDLANLRGILR